MSDPWAEYRIPTAPTRQRGAAEQFYDEMAQTALKADETQRRRQIRSTFDTFPSVDKAARANRLARQTLTPPDVVDHDLDWTERSQQAENFAWMAERYPAIGRFALANPRGAAAARDDADNLARAAQAIQGRSPPDNRSFLGKIWDVTARSLIRGGRSVIGAATNYVDLQEEYDFTTGLQRRLMGGTIYDPFQRFLGNYSRYQTEGLKARPQVKTGNQYGDTALQGLESVPSTIAALTFSAITRNPSAALAYIGVQAEGEAYLEGREKGLSPTRATGYAVPQAVFEVAGERLPIVKYIEDLNVGSSFFKTVLKQVAAENVGEQFTGHLQDFNEWATFNQDKSFGDFMRERPQAAISIAVATTAAAGLSGTTVEGARRGSNRIASILDRRLQARQAAADAETVDTIMSASEKSKLRSRDEESWRQYIDQQSEGTPVENLFLPAETLRTLFQSEGFDDRGFFNDYQDQIAEAIATNGDVVIPLADAASRLAGTKAWESIKDDVRLSPGGVSLNEARSFDEAMADEVATMGDELTALSEQERAALEPRQKIAEAMRDKLMLAGFRPDVAGSYSELIAGRYAVRAARLGEQLTGDEAGSLEVRQVLPERLAQVQAADQLDLVIQALKRGNGPRSDRRRFGKSLLEFIAERGGVEDRGGDIESMGGAQWHRDRPGRRKLVRPLRDAADLLGARGANDNTPDALALAAWEAGYFPNKADRPSVDEFLEAVGGELRGVPVYAEDRTEVTDEVREAAQELEALLDQQGMDAATANPKDIRAAVERYQSEAREGRTLDQSYMDGPRGRITFATGGKSIIDLFESRDLSTFIHESGHLFLEELWADASGDTAPEQLKADRTAVIAWFRSNGIKMPKDGSIPTEAHELWARGFERFAMEGKAPSSALRRAFDAFRSWLLTIYKVVDNLRAPIGPEIRSVMERLIATDEEIEQAREEQGLKALFKTAAEAGMSEAEFAAYQAAAAESRDEAHDALLYRTMAAIRRERTKAWKEEEAGVRSEVADRVDEEPVFRALRMLTGPDKTRLDRAWLVETYGEDVLGTLPRRVPPIYSDRNTASADLLAEMSGFTSGDELVRMLQGHELATRELRAAGDKRSVRQAQIDQQTADVMLERHGDILNDGSIEDEARALIHNEKVGEVIASEIRALARRANKRPTPYTLARQWAADKIAKSRVVDSTSGAALQRYERAARNAAKAAEVAMLSGNVDETYRQKQAQMLNNALILEAKRAKDRVDSAVARLGKLAKRRAVSGLDQAYLDRIHELLERYDFRPRSQRSIDEREGFEAWAERKRAEGYEIPAPDRLAWTGTPWSRMTVEELIGLDDTVKTLRHFGRQKDRLLKDAEKRRVQDIAEQIRARLAETGGGGGLGDQRTRNVPFSAFKRGYKQFLAMHRKMASLARQMDGGEDAGPMWEFFIRPMNESADFEAEERAAVTRKLHELIQPPLAEGPMGGKGKFFPHLGISLNREEQIGIVLNMGNAGNMQRLLDGEGWAREAVQPVLDNLSKADMDFVQAVWDLFESYRPAIGAKEKRVYGFEPEWIEPVALETRHGTYRGGYYPVKYDPRRSTKAQQDADAEEAKRQMMGAYTSATTRRSFTKERVKEVRDRPLLYNLTGLYQGLNEVIHDLAWHEWLIDVNRLLRNRVIDGAMRSEYGPEAIGVFKSAIQDIAAGDVPAQNVFESAINHIRTGATVAGLGWSFKTALLQPFGLTQSMVRIGPAWVAKGLRRWFAAPFDVGDEIRDKSVFMKNRAATMQREINEIQNRITRGSSPLGEFIRSSFFILIQKTQMTVDIPTWLGAYEKAAFEGHDEETAVALADQVVRDAQGGGQISDLAAIQRGGPLQKLFTNFYSFFNTTYNLSAESVARTDFRKPEHVMRLCLDFLLLYSLPATMGFLLEEAFRTAADDEEDWVENLAAEQLSFLFGTMVGVRELTSAAQSLAGVRQYENAYGGPAGLRVFQEADKFGKQVDQGEADRALRKSLVNTAGILFHLPSGQINKTWDGVSALSAGDSENPAVLLTGAAP